MAKDITKKCDFFAKKLLSYAAYTVNDLTRDTVTGDASNHYLVGYLPEDCVIQDAYVFVQVVQSVPPLAGVDVGIAPGDNSIMDTGTLSVLGRSGDFNGPIYTGFGTPIYINLGSDPTGTWTVVIEYLELSVRTGSYTRI